VKGTAGEKAEQKESWREQPESRNGRKAGMTGKLNDRKSWKTRPYANKLLQRCILGQ
jgi:hypothetical protein